jgi:proline iminopeptidase
MSSQSGSIDAGGFKLQYSIEGLGTPTIVIGSALYYPRVFSQSLREELRLIFLDHRGFAHAPADIEPASFELDTLVDDVERARQELGLGQVAVMGHSGHSYMALEYAKKYPTNVSHVVMIGIAPDLSAGGAEAAERYWQESVSPERKALLEANRQRLPDDELGKLSFSESFRGAYIRDGAKIWFDPKFDSTPLWEGVEVNEVVERVWGEVFPAIDITNGLDALDLPVFLALGRYDFLVAPPSSWDRVRPAFRDLTVRVFERSGHTPPLEEAELFDAELLGWMRQNR